MSPLIGITTYDGPAQWRGWSMTADLLPHSYVDAVRRAGGRPVLLPPGGSPAEVAATVAGLDGLVISGGPDLDPAHYGAEPHPLTVPASADRDSWELAALNCALTQAVPLLAICRGIQLLNVARGGTLHQHLPHVVGHEGHSGEPTEFGSHPVRIGGAGALAGIFGPDGPGADGPWLNVPTHHHQAIDRLGDGLVASAWAEDGTVEAVEFAAFSPEAPHGFALGVQWHPEEGDDPRLFAALVTAAGR
jgi:gamma-glutamyl-gamma-aminobutyrate hydrolase PuuD